ncbi:uncharacterized protein METZ01_LOCUS443303 [marine metagenome]|uniref:Uncharacterized protein n=1 Tax=marine metagenome TaxID=408172 RepID=A0A382Z5I9_9ZZZZ
MRLFSLLGEFISTIFEKTGDAIEATSDALSSATETAESTSIGCLVVVILLVTGIVAGIVISGVFPDRIFSTIPITGVSLLITPLVMGLLMSLVGKWKVNHDRKTSFMATFLGGALFGLAAAATRLIYISQG